MAVSSAKKTSSDTREACEWLERRLAWVIEEWNGRGIRDYPDPDRTEMMDNIMAELAGMLNARFEFMLVREEGWIEIRLCGIGAYSRQNIRTALHSWVSRARLCLSVAAEEATKPEPMARAA